MRPTLIALPMVFSVITAANADNVTNFIDGNTLMAWCGSSRDAYGPNNPSCLAYVMGASDVVDMNRAFNNMPSCTPKGASNAQLADMVLRYLREHPEQRHLSGGAFVQAVMGKEWCNH